MEKVLVLVLLSGVAFGNVLKVGDRGKTINYSNGFQAYYNTGYYYHFTEFISDLKTVNYDNTICSVKQTGMWIYYENADYNTFLSGQLYWVHGVDISVDFPLSMCAVTTSLKYAGNKIGWNEDSFTLYTGEYFTGDENFGYKDTPTLYRVKGDTSSLVITGLSGWTMYTGTDFTGFGFCFYPDTDIDMGPDKSILNFGIYGSMSSIGVPDNAFFSAKKGCYSSTVIKAKPLVSEHRSQNGAWGIINVQH